MRAHAYARLAIVGLKLVLNTVQWCYYWRITVDRTVLLTEAVDYCYALAALYGCIIVAGTVRSHMAVWH